MTIKLNKFTLSDETMEQMKKVMHDSKQSKQELGFTLCADKKDTIYPRNICTGECKSVDIDVTCNEGEKYVGSYHTHYNAPSYPSAGDAIKCGLMENICIAGLDSYKCYTWKHEPISPDKYDKFINLLINDTKDIDDPVHRKNFDCIKDFGPLFHTERQVYKFDKIMLDNVKELLHAKQQNLPKHKIDEMENIISTNLKYRENVANETVEKIEQLLPKYYEKKILW